MKTFIRKLAATAALAAAATVGSRVAKAAPTAVGYVAGLVVRSIRDGYEKGSKSDPFEAGK